MRPKTIFCDIDGTLIKHDSPEISFKSGYKMVLLEGTLEKLLEWDRLGYNIILTTGRKESMRAMTQEQLDEVGIFYDQLIMGLGGGERYLINDTKPDGTITARSISLERNEGIKNINIL
jgi:hydroxymethylpyrimidine pyrophosphatase-like HAD family hydrolase